MTALADLVRTTGQQPRVTGRHRPTRRRGFAFRLPRRFGPGLLLVAGLAQASAATGWAIGYGWSPAGVVAAAGAALTLLIRVGVRW
ncbi:hypothetical protein [Nonomuraea sp. KM90]|uniref:hypothetical protein n=1 Tax=Nonomuraea sp. KM90 TaxID=3457428 RepID=UPI003FCD70F9